MVNASHDTLFVDACFVELVSHLRPVVCVRALVQAACAVLMAVQTLQRRRRSSGNNKP
jgi:hypothetical protein